MRPSWSRITADEAKAFAEGTLLSTARKVPVVALTTSASTHVPWIDPEDLAKELAHRASVVLIETGEATWALGAALPKRLDVYGGAARIWWPGLTRESDPFDHVLLLIHDEREASRARERILAAIVGGDESAGRWSRGERATTKEAPPPRPAMPPRADVPDPWQRIAEEYRVDDVVPGRVFRIEPRYALVELLPGASVIVPLSEIDFTWLNHPGDVLGLGERVNVKLLELDPAARRGTASIRYGQLASAREGIALRPGEAAYVGAESVEESDAHVRRSLQHVREVNVQQGEELEAAIEDRKRLAQQCEEQKQQLAAARKELRGAEGRILALEARIAGELDPLASESTFLAAVRVEYARRFDEADRAAYPLQRMRVGRSFLESLRALQGIELEKVVEVCAQVAAGRAHEIPGRAVHELTQGVAGRATVRASDGAKAWRCALQTGTPSARRLHWWSVPHAGGATIEFASVAVHDEYSIPT